MSKANFLTWMAGALFACAVVHAWNGDSLSIVSSSLMGIATLMHAARERREST
jgi:hypothetical protein